MGILRISTFFTIFIIPIYILITQLVLKEFALIRIDPSLFKKKYFLFPFIVLNLFCALYFPIAISYKYIEYADGLVYFFKIILLYICGFSLNFRRSTFPSSLICLSIVSGGILTTYLSVLQGASNIGISNYQLASRKVIHFWSGELVNGPAMDMLNFFGLSLFPFIIESLISLVDKKRSRSKLLSIINIVNLTFSSILFCLSLYSALSLLSRTSFVCLFGSGLIYVVHKLIVIKVSFKYVLNYGLSILSITIIIIFCLQFIVAEQFANSLSALAIVERFGTESLETPRYILWLIMLTDMWNYPFGGRLVPLSPENYAHNLWLDVAFDVGILPMFLLVFFHLMHVRHFYKIFTSNSYKSLGTLVICFTVAIFAAFLGTPVLQASPDYFAITCFFMGLLTGLSERYNKTNILE